MAAVEDDWVRQVQGFFSKSSAHGGAPGTRRRSVSRHPHRSIVAAVEEFAHRRRRNLTLLNALGLETGDLLRAGAAPQLRATTLGRLLTDWARHDLVSLARIARSLLGYYERELEPWMKYFSLLAEFEARHVILTGHPRDRI